MARRTTIEELLPENHPLRRGGALVMTVSSTGSTEKRSSRPSPMTPEELAATKPARSSFKTEEEFEEALGRWMAQQGRSPMLRQLKDSQLKSKSTDASEPSDRSDSQD